MTTNRKRAAISREINLATKRADIQDRADAVLPCKKFGGITLWSTSEEQLNSGIAQVQAAIESCSKEHLTITRNVLRKLVRDRLRVEVDDKVFSAILGSLLRSGAVDAILCASKNDKSYRVLIHREQLGRFQKAVDAALGMLESGATVEVRELERAVFGKRAYNTWSSASHIFSYLSYKGRTELGETGSCALVHGCGSAS